MSLPMEQVSSLTAESSRNPAGPDFQALSLVQRGQVLCSMVLRRLAPEGTAKRIAEKLDLSESTISRAKDDAERVCALIACLDYKLVDVKKICVDPGEINTLRRVYARACQLAPWIVNEEGE